ncbi:hypothetical protein [Hyphomicrobium sp.]|uniref:hypothetical protein n=1 Tax=Hyphomicrobium sp. TaxID=82 RepID=UPI001DAF41D4|nr:hypothetical protein [Hyphomicrobium sp.]MBY0561438.1 hypothetical protein [Hyphomicrobium sp.]
MAFKNPYRTSTRNLTQQWAIEKQDPTWAARLKLEAELDPLGIEDDVMELRELRKIALGDAVRTCGGHFGYEKVLEAARAFYEFLKNGDKAGDVAPPIVVDDISGASNLPPNNTITLSEVAMSVNFTTTTDANAATLNGAADGSA